MASNLMALFNDTVKQKGEEKTKVEGVWKWLVKLLEK